ncbi:uncharacterized protein EHS24_002718 [Apiotrichum porosum]|uniref:Uncharacterized protein n=1 Tax=Apiotrichum porosum TaxID=105984 RepID=A0A427XHP7_9TREE|nr:uncharacterized protein EHS24_002718 [Apiotrichum porosum]RSH78254.1 hypothetical protein EHS24_002718 [Apiotrichum porosum]
MSGFQSVLFSSMRFVSQVQFVRRTPASFGSLDTIRFPTPGAPHLPGNAGPALHTCFQTANALDSLRRAPLPSTFSLYARWQQCPARSSVVGGGVSAPVAVDVVFTEHMGAMGAGEGEEIDKRASVALATDVEEGHGLPRELEGGGVLGGVYKRSTSRHVIYDWL